MEYLPCGTLRQLISRSRMLTETEIRHIICEIIVAMEFVHKAGYVLRDLKVKLHDTLFLTNIIQQIV